MKDATQPASNDSKQARITIPFSAETRSAQVLDTKLPADLSGLPANLNEKNVSFHEALFASCSGGDDDNDVAPARDAALPREDTLPRDDTLPHDEDDDLFGELPSFLPVDKPSSNYSDVSPRDTGSPRKTKRSRDDVDASLRAFLSSLLSPRLTDNASPVVSRDYKSRDSEHPVIPEIPVVDDDFIHVDKKPCLDRDKKPGLEE